MVCPLFAAKDLVRSWRGTNRRSSDCRGSVAGTASAGSLDAESTVTAWVQFLLRDPSMPCPAVAAVAPCCRSAAATAAAAARLGGAAIDAGAGADLASVASARAFAGALRAAGVDSVDALVFASGVVSAPLSAGRTVEGYDLNVGVNAVGPLALALGALDLVRAARGRVVLVGSTAALDVPPSTAFLDDLAYNTSRPHAPRAAYAESKALGVLLVDELARREEELGTGVTANVIHPGPAATLAVRYELPARYEQRLGMSEEQLAQQVCVSA